MMRERQQKESLPEIQLVTGKCPGSDDVEK